MPDGPAEAKWQCLPETDRIFSARPDRHLSGTYSGRLWDTRDTQRSLCAMFLIKWPKTLPVYHRRITLFHRAACGCSFITVSARRQIWRGV
jgi:hypothetical protein